MTKNTAASENFLQSVFPLSASKDDAKYDLAKFFLSLFVLAIHANLSPMTLYPWLRTAVPLFFIMSSFFLFSKISNVSADKHKGILKKFVARNLQLYVCWFIILLPITVYIRRKLYFSHGFWKNILTIIKSFLFGSTFVASWYIMASIIGVVIIFFLSKWLRNHYLVFFLSLFAFGVVTLASSYTQLIADTCILTAIEKYYDIFGGLVLSFPAALFWVFIGKLFAEQNIQIKSFTLLVILLICSCIALFAEWKFVYSLGGTYRNDSYFMLAPLCILLFLSLQKIKPLYWKYSICFRRASTIIYVAHGSLLSVVSKLIAIAFHVNSPFLSFISTFICCIAIYILVELAIVKFRNRPIGKIVKMLY